MSGSESEAKRILRGIDGAKLVDGIGSREPGSYDFAVETDRDADVRKPMFNALSKAGMPILMLRPADATLEDIFLKLTDRSGEE